MAVVVLGLGVARAGRGVALSLLTRLPRTLLRGYQVGAADSGFRREGLDSVPTPALWGGGRPCKEGLGPWGVTDPGLCVSPGPHRAGWKVEKDKGWEGSFPGLPPGFRRSD